MLARRHILFFVMPVVAIVLSIITCASFFTPIHLGWGVTQRHWAIAHFFDGRMRLFWVHSHGDEIEITPYRISPNFRVDAVGSHDVTSSGDNASSGASRSPTRNKRMRVSIGNRRTVAAFGGRWAWNRNQPANAQALAGITYVRMPSWLPISLMLLAPLRYVFRGPVLERHRMRRNRCTMCGYSLKGLPEPRCPECGTAVVDMAQSTT